MGTMQRLRRPPLILAYHGLGEVARRHDPDSLMLHPERFRAQVHRLRARGYRFLKLTELANRIEGGHGPAGCCALTFDDGSSDAASVLPELLAELDVCATLFVCPGLLGRPHFGIAPEAGVRLLTAEELGDLRANERFEIGSHTNRHRSLATATRAEALAEMRASREALERHIGRSVTSFAYPGCAYSPECPGAAADAGFAVAVTCAPAGGWRRYELTRESIDRLDGRFTFALKARGLWEPIYASGLGAVGRRLRRRHRHPEAIGSQ